jgi:hypothetical protein
MNRCKCRDLVKIALDERGPLLAGRYSLRTIWEDLALPELAYAFRLAVGPIKLAIAFLAVAVICICGYLMDRCTQSVVLCPETAQRTVGQVGSVTLRGISELEVYLISPEQVGDFVARYKGLSPGQGVFSTLWSFSAGRFNDASKQLFNLGQASFFSNLEYVFVNLWLCGRAIVWAVRFHPLYSSLFLTFTFVVLCFACGAVCRCAALEYARHEKPGFFEAFDFAYSKFRSLLSAPLLPAVLVLVPSALILAVGMLGAIPRLGELLIGVLFGVVVLLGLAAVGMLLGATAGGLLLFPAVAYEATTGRDAIGRAVSYVLNRPLWMLFYIFVAGLFGTFFYVLIRVVIYLVLKVVYGLLAEGMTLAGGDIEKLNRLWTGPALFSLMSRPSNAAVWSESIGAFFIYLFFLLLIGLLAAYIITYICCASTIVYALVRKKVDRVEPEVVYLPLAYERPKARTEP